MNLEEWTCAVKIAGSKKSKYLISKIIKEQCLITKKSYMVRIRLMVGKYGMYLLRMIQTVKMC